MLGAAIIGLGFLIFGLIGAKGIGEKFQFGCLITIALVVVVAILFVALLSAMM